MELFDKLGDTLVSVTKDATQKAKDISELARISMEIHSKQDYINKLYQEIGRLYFEAHKDDEQQEFEDEITLLKDSQEVLEDLKRQKNQLKGTIKCDNCGQEIPSDADFCSKCGSKLEKTKKEEEVVIDPESEESAEDSTAQSKSAEDSATQSDGEAVENSAVQTENEIQAK